MSSLNITFIMKELSATLYYGKPVNYKGVEVGTITDWKIGEDKRIYITATITSESFVRELMNGQVAAIGLEISKDKK